MALVQSLTLQQDYPTAQALLKKVSQQQPNNPAIWSKLAELNGFNEDTVGIHLANAESFILRGHMDEALQQLHYAYQKSDKNFRLSTLIDQRKEDIKTLRKELEQFE